MPKTKKIEILTRIASALEHLTLEVPAVPGFDAATAYVWQSNGSLLPVPSVNRVEMNLLKGIERVRDQLLENTERFAAGLPANNALLWGARGMGKSSLVKACHNDVAAAGNPLKLVEIHREDIEGLPTLMSIVRANVEYRFIVFCDDLSFDRSYRGIHPASNCGSRAKVRIGQTKKPFPELLRMDLSPLSAHFQSCLAATDGVG